MSDIKGDVSKKPPQCRIRPGSLELGIPCPYIKETGGGFDGERYRCETCGESFFLDYEDMK